MDEAAQFLRVTPRTIYRRIWNGDLPASKVGGLYYIRRSDLEELLESGRVRQRKGEEAELSQPALKCGYCLRLLDSDEQIGEVCRATGCEKLICTTCQSQGRAYCAQHAPDRSQRWEAAQAEFQRGALPLLVKGSTARLRELNFINRIHNRLASITDLAHPLGEEVLRLEAWDQYRQPTDRRTDVMRLLGKVMLDTGTLASLPLDAGLHYRLPLPPRSRSLPLEIRVQVVSHLEIMVRDGFDTRPLGEEALTPWLERFSEAAQGGDSFQLVVLAATTGWDFAARQVVQGLASGEGKAAQRAFAHRHILFYLFDLEKGELLYNLLDERARRYAELFAPLLPEEELAEVVEEIERQMSTYDTLTLGYAAQVLPYPRALIRRAFTRMAESGPYALTQVPEYGETLVRR